MEQVENCLRANLRQAEKTYKLQSKMFIRNNNECMVILSYVIMFYYID